MHPWKAQKIRSPVSGGIPGRCRYEDLSKPLPDPPAGRTWVQDVFTREWMLSESAVVRDGDDGAAVATFDGDAPVDAAIVEREGSDDDPPEQSFAAAESNTETAAVAVAVAVEAVAAVPVLILTDDAVEAEPLSPSDGVSSSPSSSTVYHDVKPTDTFQGLCLQYGVTAAALRRANGILTGADLLLAPGRLVIPAIKYVSCRGGEKEQRTGDQKVVEFVDHFAHRKRVHSIERNVLRAAPVYDGSTTGDSKLGFPEARAYLEMNDWDVDRAIRDAEDDLRWDLENDGGDDLRRYDCASKVIPDASTGGDIRREMDPPAVAVAAGTEIEMSATAWSSKKNV